MVNILISIIMPVYNSGEYLETAVGSILNQSFRDLELILVDDGSTDGSSEKCDEYAEKDDRVVVVHQKNGGICKARNAALKVARGVYIGFSDHDDDFETGVFEECISLMEKYNYPDMIKFGKKYIFIDEHSVKYREIELTHKNEFLTRQEMIDKYLLLRQQSLFRFVWDGLYKKEIVDKYNIQFDPYFKYGGEDHDFCNTISRYLNSIVTTKNIYYNHYLRKKTSTSSKVRENAGIMHYEIEGKRLHETLSCINYSIKDNTALYCNQIFETCVLPIIRYHIKCKTNDTEIYSFILNALDFSFVEINSLKPSLLSLLSQSKKIGLFTYFFYNKKIKLLISLIKLRYKLMKS